MKYQTHLFIGLIFINTGCSLIGNKLGEKVDNVLDEEKYADQYAKEGLEEDVKAIKAFLTPSKKNKEEWKDPWVEKQELQYCSQIPSCWDKRVVVQKLGSEANIRNAGDNE